MIPRFFPAALASLALLLAAGAAPTAPVALAREKDYFMTPGRERPAPSTPPSGLLYGDPAVEKIPRKVRVILDPGHGGADLGARSAGHILEKNITLKLSRLLHRMLEDSEMIEVIPVRPDDLGIPAIRRIEFANAQRGELYLGLHADGGISPRSHPMKIFINSASTQKSGGGPEGWKHLNDAYGARNEKMAAAIAGALARLEPKRGVEIVKTPLLTLNGLAMPAVVVEPVDLSNPEDEIRLENDDYLQGTARAIAGAVIDYLRAAEARRKPPP